MTPLASTVSSTVSTPNAGAAVAIGSLTPADRLPAADRLIADMLPTDSLIVALDFPSAAQSLDLVDRLDGLCRWFKVGMELYYAVGNPIIEQLRRRDCQVFLDLKLHDIPNTVAGAVRTLTNAGASLLTVHAAGGESMLRAAAEAASAPGAPRLLAVTVLTSMDDADLQSIGVSPPSGAETAAHTQVLRLAQLARTAGIEGLVCSAQEVGAVRDLIGREALLVVPGIRPAGADAADQSRIATPADAIARGASMLVVGRPITRAANPAKAAQDILSEMAASR